MTDDLAAYMGNTPMRPLNNIENDAEIHAYFDNEVAERGGRARAQLTCGWCGTNHQAHRDQMLRWFNNHACNIDELQASRNRRIIVARNTEAIAA